MITGALAMSGLLTGLAAPHLPPHRRIPRSQARHEFTCQDVAADHMNACAGSKCQRPLDINFGSQSGTPTVGHLRRKGEEHRIDTTAALELPVCPPHAFR
jgi:hypothetical protein